MNKNDAQLRQEDEAARKLARSEFRAPVILEAGAGTGKTATLVARVLVWALGQGWMSKSDDLVDPDQERIAAAVLDGIVAITFTEKASVEMGQRLAEATRQIIKKEPVIGIDSDDLPSPAIAESRAKSVLAQLDRIHIETIHAFCRRTLAENSLAAGLHPEFELDADGTLVATTIRDVVSEWMSESLNGETSDDVTQLMTQRLGPSALEAATQLIVSEGVPAPVLACDPYPEARCQEVAQSMVTAIRDVVDLALPCFAESKKKLVLKSRDCLQSLADIGSSIEEAKNVEDLCLALESLDLKGEHKKIDEWAKKGPNKTDSKELEASSIDPKELKTHAAILVPLLKSTATWNPEILRPAFRVLSVLTERVRSQLLRQGVLTFNGLLRECRDLLGDNELVCNKLRESIDQLLVDEVQDTDPLQYDIVRSLAFGDDPKPSLFVVGDPKQTIYGFRNADLGAYDSFMSEIENMGGQKRALSVNFRSDPPILEEVERIVGPTMIAQAGLQPQFEKLLCAPKRIDDRFHDAHGRRAVEYWNSWSRYAHRVEETDKILAKTSAGRARKIEANAIAAEIASLHLTAGTPYKSFAILMKATTQQETYLTALRNLGVPYLVEKDKQFFRRREVIDASSALTCVLDCHDQVSLLSWLRSTAVGLPDAALLPLWSHGLPQKLADLNGHDADRLATIESLVDEAAASLSKRSEELGLSRLPLWPTLLKKAAQDLSALRHSICHDTIDIFFAKFRQRFAYEAQESARFLGGHRVANLRRFLKKSQELLSRPDLGRDEALRLIRGNVVDALDGEEASPGDETADAVRIMSVHKSKGLDFEQVYFVALHQGHGGGSSGDQIYSRNDKWEFNLFGAATPGFGEASTHAAEVGKAEMVRTNYVAVTRAAKRLVLCGAWPADDKEPKEIGDCSRIVDLLCHRSGLDRNWESLADKTRPTDTIRDIDANDNVAWVMPDLEVSNSQQGNTRPRTEERRHDIVADLNRLQTRKSKLGAEDSVDSPVNASDLKSQPGIAVQANYVTDTSTGIFVGKPTEDAVAWANIIGTAVHRVLELLPLNEEAADFIEECRKRPEHLIGKTPTNANREKLIAGLDQKLLHLQESQILKRLSQMGDQVLGREIPLLVRQEDVDVVGSLDMLYRDQTNGQLVVVDFKTDMAESEEALLGHAKKYAAQGRAYCQAVDRSHKGEVLKTRFELWFVSADRIISLNQTP